MSARAVLALSFILLCLRRRPPCASAGAEFWCAVFITSTIAMPILLHVTHVVPLQSMVLALCGVLLATFYVGGSALLAARAAGDDAFHSW